MQEKSSRAWLPAASHAAVLAVGLLIGMRFAPAGPGPTPDPTTPARTQAARPPGPAAGEIPTRASRPARKSHPATTGTAIRLLPDGSAIVPPNLLRRINLQLMDADGRFDPAEFAHLGASEAEVRELQDLLDQANAAEHAREARSARLVRQNTEETTFWIPGGEGDTARRTTLESALLNLSGGKSTPLMETPLSNRILTLTGGWGKFSKLVTAKPLWDGRTEYTIYLYGPQPPADFNPHDIGSSHAAHPTVVQSETVPERLRHLFE